MTEHDVIILRGRIVDARPKDSHDILGVFRQIVTPAWRLQATLTTATIVQQLIERHKDMMGARPDPARMFAFTTRVSRPFHEVDWRAGDWLVFGSESAGLPPDLRERFPPAQRVRLPMRAGQRSLNLSNAVAVAVFEAWRQNAYSGGN